MSNKDKEAGKFAWFCLGTLFGWTGISKLVHIGYWAIIAILLAFAVPSCSNMLEQLLLR